MNDFIITHVKTTIPGGGGCPLWDLGYLDTLGDVREGGGSRRLERGAAVRERVVSRTERTQGHRKLLYAQLLYCIHN